MLLLHHGSTFGKAKCRYQRPQGDVTPFSRKRSLLGSDPTMTISRAALVHFQLSVTTDINEATQPQEGTQAPELTRATRASRPARLHHLGPAPPPAALSDMSHPEVFDDFDSNTSMHTVDAAVEHAIDSVTRTAAPTAVKSQGELLRAQVEALQLRLDDIERWAPDRPSHRAITSNRHFKNGELKPG